MIANCNCVHPGQDELNGPGRRVHNDTKDGLIKCTVCGEKKSRKVDAPTKKGKK